MNGRKVDDYDGFFDGSCNTDKHNREIFGTENRCERIREGDRLNDINA